MREIETREERDAGALIRQRMQEKQEMQNEREEQEAIPQKETQEGEASPAIADAPAVAEAPTETQEGQGPEPAPLTRRQLRAKARLEKAAQKEEQKEAARQKQQLLRKEKARAMDRKRGEKRQRRQEKRERRAQIRAERREEIRSLTGFAGFAMLVVFALLAVDQAGLYGFLFVWLFLGVAAASVALLLLGILRAVRRKRCGIVFLLSLIGIAASIVWGAFLSAPWGLGLGPVFFIR